MTVIVRKMKEEDIPQVQQVAKKSWNATYDGIIPDEVQENFLKSAYSDTMMRKRFDISHLFVAETEGRVTGFANFSPVNEAGKAELGAIYLLPDQQGRGTGTMLLELGLETIEGIQELTVDVEKDNKIGMNFYKAKGFEKVGEYDDDFNGHILRTIRMVLHQAPQK
ncbi:GNAT family N-acetyltransferase [Virgibacillus kekensis]|uniref:GNAT family N-acetyltransferase n=1 Tax=Virgibacillus kekensis TaxID=202261 RepID=A0ABV9DPU7_9BACI